MRSRSKPVVVLSIVLVLASALGGWHAPDDADEFAVPAAQQQFADHQVTTPSHPTAPEHCALCHWLQALGKAAPASAQVAAASSSQLIRIGALLERVRTSDRLALSSRAPPLV